MIDIPNAAVGITAPWLTSVLRASRRDLPEIASMEVQRIAKGVGVLSEIYRLKLRYSGDGGAGPPSLIVKIPPQHQVIRNIAAADGFFEREVTFYRDLAGATPVRSAACYGAAYDPATANFVLVLEDICEATGGDQIAGLDLGQLRAAVDTLAALHTSWWDRPELRALEGIVQPYGVAPYGNFNARHAGGWARIHPFLKERISPRMMRVGERMCERLDDIVDESLAGPRTLCHGDFRAENLMFETGKHGAAGLVALDWQFMTQSAGPFDLGYMMSGSVETELRREHEMGLLRSYHDMLVAGGVEGYDFGRCLRDYRRALLMGFTYCVQGGAPRDLTNPRSDALITGIARRCEAAVQDHDLEDFLS
jgi:hypothetical protein